MPSMAKILEVGRYQVRQALNFSRGPMRRVYASGGGHGSVYFVSALRPTLRSIHVRPDTVFDTDKCLDDLPDEASVPEFKEKTGFTLDTSKTINDNMMSYLGYLEEVDALVLLSRMSRLGKFFTRNGLTAPICLVRHPLHAYVSFIGHRHPKAGEQFGGLEADATIRWYADQWNSMTSDYLESGCRIVRFEYMQDDVKGLSNPDLPALLKHWRTDVRNNNVLPHDKEGLMKELVSDTYSRIYKAWDI